MRNLQVWLRQSQAHLCVLFKLTTLLGWTHVVHIPVASSTLLRVHTLYSEFIDPAGHPRIASAPWSFLAPDRRFWPGSPWF